jgi:hypothetical protein
MNYLNSTPSKEMSTTAILDSGATGNFLDFDAPHHVNEQIAVTPMEVKLPNEDFIRSTHIAPVNITALPIAARIGRIFPNHFQHSLLSVGQLCDNDQFLSPHCYMSSPQLWNHAKYTVILLADSQKHHSRTILLLDSVRWTPTFPSHFGISSCPRPQSPSTFSCNQGSIPGCPLMPN